MLLRGVGVVISRAGRFIWVLIRQGEEDAGDLARKEWGRWAVVWSSFREMHGDCHAGAPSWRQGGHGIESKHIFL